jgi:hypothetical protein
MRRSTLSPRNDPIIPSPPDRMPTILDGSATQRRTKKNSKGPCSHDVSNKRIIRLNPPISDASINVAPRLKNPTKLPVNNENARNNQFLVRTRSGGVHRTLLIIKGYRKDKRTGRQLFAKMRSMTATSPTALAARTGMKARVFSRNTMKLRNGTKRAVINAPAKEPSRKARSVAPKALSMYFMFRISPASTMYHQGV